MTQQRASVPYGLWPSPLQPQHLADGLRLTDVAWDSDGPPWYGMKGGQTVACWCAYPRGRCAQGLDDRSVEYGRG